MFFINNFFTKHNGNIKEILKITNPQFSPILVTVFGKDLIIHDRPISIHNTCIDSKKYIKYRNNYIPI